ncbi:anti-RNA polymerase sigma factor SigE [Klebsiella variicola]|nr:anti-RNA polymerase sigma factor SigE [Klebsiella variicola]
MQKEQLSALMDGETLDKELLNELSRSSEMQKTWESYHLIRDTLRGDTAEVLQFDISARVMAAIENEPVRQTRRLFLNLSPHPTSGADAVLEQSASMGQLTHPNGRCRLRIACGYRRRPAL